jgi:hypothetical protein
MHLFRKLALAGVMGLVGCATGAPAGQQAARPFDPRIGSHWPMGFEFASMPPRSQPLPGSACEIADAYVKLIAADRAPEVPALFAPDGVFIGPPDRVHRGPAEINKFYSRVHQGGAIPLSFIDRGDECIMELAGQRATPTGPQYKLVAIDHFTINADRKITSLVIYVRPDPYAATPATRAAD